MSDPVEADVLNLDDLAEHHPGVTTHVAGALYEATCVCLSDRHTSPSQLAFSHETGESTYGIAWQPPSTQVKRAHAFEPNATE